MDMSIYCGSSIDTVLQTDFPANFTSQCRYFMTPCGATYHMNEGNLHESELAEGEEVDSRY